MRLRTSSPRAGLLFALAATLLITLSFPSALVADNGDQDEVVCVVLDEDSIDNGSAPNFFTDLDVNDDKAQVGLRDPLPYWVENVGKRIWLHTGQVGDEGWFQPRVVIPSWTETGPTNDGLVNFMGALWPDGVIRPGVGLGTPDETGNNTEAHLDKIPDVLPLREAEIRGLIGSKVFAVVYDSDISINYNPLEASLTGANLGVVAFRVIQVVDNTGGSSSSLPKVEIEILDPTRPENQCNNTLDVDVPEA